jgi:hypothetical protein
MTTGVKVPKLPEATSTALDSMARFDGPETRTNVGKALERRGWARPVVAGTGAVSHWIITEAGVMTYMEWAEHNAIPEYFVSRVYPQCQRVLQRARARDGKVREALALKDSEAAAPQPFQLTVTDRSHRRAFVYRFDSYGQTLVHVGRSYQIHPHDLAKLSETGQLLTDRYLFAILDMRKDKEAA